MPSSSANHKPQGSDLQDLSTEIKSTTIQGHNINELNPVRKNSTQNAITTPILFDELPQCRSEYLIIPDNEN
jgi:hypothetical protein